MKTVYLVYSIPDYDSRDCDRRIEKAITIPAGLYFIPTMSNCQKYIEKHAGDDLAEFEYLEIWQDGKRIDVICPIPDGIVT